MSCGGYFYPPSLCGFGKWTQITRLTEQMLYPLNHLSGFHTFCLFLLGAKLNDSISNLPCYIRLTPIDRLINLQCNSYTLRCGLAKILKWRVERLHKPEIGIPAFRWFPLHKTGNLQPYTYIFNSMIAWKRPERWDILMWGKFYKVLPLGEKPKVAHGSWGRERISLSSGPLRHRYTKVIPKESSRLYVHTREKAHTYVCVGSNNN